MEKVGKVRRMKMDKKLANSEIAMRKGLSRSTVKKWLNAPGDEIPKYRRQIVSTKLSEFKATVLRTINVDAHRPKHARQSTRTLFAQLKAQTYRGN